MKNNFLKMLFLILLLSASTGTAIAQSKQQKSARLTAEVRAAIELLKQNTATATANVCLKIVYDFDYTAKLIASAVKTDDSSGIVRALACAVEKLDREGKHKEFYALKAVIEDNADATTYQRLVRKLSLTNNKNAFKKVKKNKEQTFEPIDHFEVFIADSIKAHNRVAINAAEATF